MTTTHRLERALAALNGTFALVLLAMSTYHRRHRET